MLRVCWILREATPTAADITAALRVLGLDTNATTARVRAQYLRLARLHHPDLSSGDDHKMKVINTAYELLQRGNVLHAQKDQSSSSQVEKEESHVSPSGDTKHESRRFTAKAGKRRKRVPHDFADGDTWTMKSTLEWDTLISHISRPDDSAELRNPANHPFSHSRFFSFEEDTVIYRMIRGGATVPQTARTLGKPATFVERRLHNAQFKQRIQYLLQHEKRQKQEASSLQKGPTGKTANASSGSVKMHGRVFGSADTFHTAMKQQQERREGRRKKEWEPTVPDWESPTFFTEMTLEEKGRYAQLLREEQEQQHVPLWKNAASQLGRSYANYARFAGSDKKNKSKRSS